MQIFRPQTQQRVQERDEQYLQEQFRTLSLLHTFFTALNDPNRRSVIPGKGFLPPRSADPKVKLIEAVLALLVRDTEILAGMSYGLPLSDKVLVAFVPGATGEFLGAQNAQSQLTADPTPKYVTDLNTLVRVAAITNPDDSDLMADLPKDRYILLSGQEVWSILNSPTCRTGFKFLLENM
jgi:hypothetical protein